MKDKIITSNCDESYKELKASLKEKYTRILCTAIDEAREVVIKRSSEILSKEYLSMLSETEGLKKTVKEQETEFFNSEKYVTAQKSLTTLKDKLATCLDSEKESIQKDLSKLLEQITTMNITIKNRLKVYTDKIKENEKILKEETLKVGVDVLKIKNEIMKFLQQKISECVKCFNEELSELNKTFAKEDANESELPFDTDVIKLDVPIFSIDTDSIKRSVKTTDDDQNITLINSKNTSTVKN